MRSILTRIAGMSVAALVAAGALTSASAATWDDSWNDGWNRPLVSADVGYRPGYYGPGYTSGPLIEAPVAAQPYGGTVYGGTIVTPGAALQYAPRRCFTDEGYGRFQPCDHGGQ